MKNTFILNIVLLLLCGVFGDEVKLSVMEGDSVTLHTDLTDMNGVIKIIWRFGEEDSRSVIVVIAGRVDVDDDDDVDERFRDRLQVNHQTGDLNIKNMRIKHSGRYQAQIIKGGSKYKTFTVTVYDPPHVLEGDAGEVKSVSVMEGDSVILHTDLTDIQKQDLILWRFGSEGRLIAKVDKEDNKRTIHDDDDDDDDKDDYDYSQYYDYYGKEDNWISIYDKLDGGFKHRLKMNDQTGSLHISDVRSSDSGLYKLKISSNNNQTLYKTFSVYIIGAQLSLAVLVTYVVLLLLFLLVLLTIDVYLIHHKVSGLRQIIASCTSSGDKRGICVVVFHFLVKVLLVLLLVLMSVVTYYDIKTLYLKQTDDTSLTSLAVIFGVLQMMMFLTVIEVFQGVAQQKLRGKCLGVLCLLLLLMLIVVIYTVGFVDLKHIEGHTAKIYVLLLVLMCVGVIHYVSESSYAKLIKVQKTLVFEGESVFLHTGVTELQSDDVIELSFKNKVIAEFNKNNMISSDDERFRDRLQVDVQTGSLIIRNMRKEDAGLYKVKMSSSSKVKSCIQFIITGGSSYSQFNVNVYDSAGIRETESLMVVKSLLNKAEDEG